MEDFDRVAFYVEYYRNLSPNAFGVERDGNDIIITNIKKRKKNNINEMTVGKKRISESVKGLLSTEFRLNEESDIKTRITNELKSLPDVITLFRVIYVENENDINRNQPGSHYVLKKRDLESSHYQGSHVGGGEPLLLTVKANKSLIDFNETIKNRINYPHEKEITLKNKGLGAKITKVEPFISDDSIESLIGSPEDFEF